MYFNIRFSYKKIIALICMVTLIVTFVVVLRFNSLDDDYRDMPVISEAFSPADYITSFGAKIDEGKCVVDEVTVPLEFNDVYRNYNEIQKAQGFDLEKYKGKILKRYTYLLVDFDSEGSEVFAEVLTLNDRIVGADIYSTDSYGFIKALK